MANKGYEAGANFERRVKRHYEGLGYWCIRAAGSHGIADVVCIKSEPDVSGVFHTNIILVQCKTYEGWNDKTALKELAISLRVNAVYAYKRGRKLVLETVV